MLVEVVKESKTLLSFFKPEKQQPLIVTCTQKSLASMKQVLVRFKVLTNS